MNPISAFLFQLTKEEVQSLISQSAISNGMGGALVIAPTEPNKRRIGFHTND